VLLQPAEKGKNKKKKECHHSECRKVDLHKVGGCAAIPVDLIS